MKYTFVLVTDPRTLEVRKWFLVPSDIVALEEAEIIAKYPDHLICLLKVTDLIKMKDALGLQLEMRRR